MRLKEIREQRGMTQDQLADRTGITQAHISALERWADNPTLDTMRRLAAALTCSLDELAADPAENEDGT